MSWKFRYADNYAIVTQSPNFKALQITRSVDITLLANYFKRWYLNMNESKTVSCVFHLHNRQAERRLGVTAIGAILPLDLSPKYLGITLDRSLTYRQQETQVESVPDQETYGNKLGSNPIRPESSCSLSLSLSLCYGVAEYECPVWCRIAYTRKIDIQLYEVMSQILGAIRYIPLNRLQCISNIEPPAVRRQNAYQRMHAKISTTLRQVTGGAPRELRSLEDHSLGHNNCKIMIRGDKKKFF